MTDTTVAPSTGYCYAVAALDGAGSESAKSAQVCIATGAAAPPTPSGLFAEEAAEPAAGRPDLETSIDRRRQLPDLPERGDDPLLSPAGVPATDTTVAASTLYCYTISAVNAVRAANRPNRLQPASRRVRQARRRRPA